MRAARFFHGQPGWGRRAFAGPLLLLLFAPAIVAGAEWQSTGGPSCRQVTSIAEGATPDEGLYLSTSSFPPGLIFASKDRGRSWQEIAAGAAFGPFGQVVADPERPGRLFAANAVDGVFRSQDGGASWEPLRRGLPNREVVDLQLAGRTLYALTHPFYEQANLFVSDVERIRWTGVSLPASFLVSFSVHPSDAQVVVVSSELGVFASEDGGRHWLAAETDLGEPSDVRFLGFDPADRRTAYLAIGSWLFKTIDLRTWRQIGEVPGPALITSLGIDPGRPSRLLAGLFVFDRCQPALVRSGDGGRSWKGVGLEGERVLELLYSRNHPRFVYAGTGQGFFRGKRTGRGWKSLTVGIDTASVGALGVVPAGSSFDGEPRIYATTSECGILHRDEDRAAWQASKQSAVSLAVSPADPRVVYAGRASNYISISGDGGRTWTTVAYTQDPASLEEIAIDPADPRRLYLAASTGGIAISDDGGLTWEVRSDTGLGFEVFAVAVDPSGPETVYAGGDAGLVKSRDRGATWGPIAPDLAGLQIVEIAVDPRRRRTVYASCLRDDEPCVYRSRDGGKTWRESASGLPAWPIHSLVADTFHRNTVYAGSVAGVFRSTDGGRTWKRFDAGLLDRQVNDLALSASGVLYAATVSRGVQSIRVAAP